MTGSLVFVWSGTPIYFGPVRFFLLLIFYPRQKRLHDAYARSGVECIGLVSQCIVSRDTEHGNAISSRKIRYAYKAPGSETIYIKNFVSVKERKRWLVKILVLPGQPESGVPDFLLSDNAPPLHCLGALHMASILLTAFCVWLYFQLIETGDRTYDFGQSVVTVLMFGFLFACLIHYFEHRSIPG